MMRHVPGNAEWRSLLFFLFLCLSCSSCAVMSGGHVQMQGEMNRLLLANRPEQAVEVLERKPSGYGAGNRLLYDLDRGLIEFYAGRHQQSVKSFEQAKDRFRELYTKSLSKEALSWAVNDYMLPYSGADHEYVLVNIFQGMNFLAMGDLNEALVEARDLASKYQVITDLAGKAKRQRYEDNGFARLFMGLLYGASGSRQDRAQALLWYKQALGLYKTYYAGQYVPLILREEGTRLAQEFADDVRGSFLEGFPDPGRLSRPGKAAQIIIFQIVGYSPVKVPEVVPVPVPVDRGGLIKITFPRFERRDYGVHAARVTVRLPTGESVSAETELGADIEDLAIRDLESRKALVLAKAALRPTMKYLLQRKQTENVEKSGGTLAADIFGLASSLYLLFSEQADLRSWQALPGQIRLARLFVDPGTSHIQLEHLDRQGQSRGIQDVGAVTLRAGETRFIVVRSLDQAEKP